MAQVNILAGGAPVASDVLVTADQRSIKGSGTAQDPLHTVGLTFPANVSSFVSGDFVVGTAATVGSLDTDGKTPIVVRCVGNTDTQFAGLCVEGTTFGLFSTDGPGVTIQCAGIVTLTAAQWDVIAGTSGGLVAGDRYWVAEGNPGHLTSTKPTVGHKGNQVGYALNTTQMVLTVAPVQTIA